MIRWKTFPWVLGLALIAFSLVAARLLNADTPVNHGAGGNPPPRVTSAAGPVGPTILGVVDSTPTAVRMDAPAVMGMPALGVSKVLVGEGDTVEVGQVLVEFDPAGLKHKLTQAQKKLIAAQWAVASANAAKDDFPNKLDLQNRAVSLAEEQLKHAEGVLARYKDDFERALQATKKPFSDGPLSDEEKERRRGTDEKLNQGTALVTELKTKVEVERIKLKQLKALPIEAPVQQAKAEVEVIQATIAEAEAQLEAFKLKAQEAGVVEQLTAVAGKTYGAAAREPLLWIIPAGKRVVRAEVEAEHSQKFEAQLGKTVTVCDHHNTALTYTGVLRRFGTAFLPKRFGSDALAPNPARVLECTVEVTDPAPAGKPPLRPGQQVRVVFGQ
jgi:multidrug resistance efflux pump